MLRAAVICLLLLLAPFGVADSTAGDSLRSTVKQHCPACLYRLENATGSYILEYGEEALMSRAWLTQQARESIDVQYFIWSTDNIGILAGEALLQAAERGVRVRVLVDDLLIDARDKTLLALAAHPNAQIKIYNPVHSVGVSTFAKLRNVVRDFRGANQRMHDKTAIFDQLIGITGGRNMADEYFDYNGQYNFRDRDVLLIGKAVAAISENFNEFWNSALAVSVGDLLSDSADKPTPQEVDKHYEMLHQYAANPMNFEPEVRAMLAQVPEFFPALTRELVWGEVTFFSDIPGKNEQHSSLAGGGQSTQFLLEKLAAAKRSVLIQSPYLVLEEAGVELLKALVARGVEVKISTNSLASTDNLMAFSGYQKVRRKLLEAGVQIFEFKPHPEIQENLLKRFPRLAENCPVFAIHAKSMVIDGEQLFIGTFNLDPRSANLNTEVGVFADNRVLAQQLTASILRDIDPANSWRTSVDFNPDAMVPWSKRLHAALYRLLPLTKVL